MKIVLPLAAIVILSVVFTFANSATPGNIVFPKDQLQSSLENELQDGRWELVMFWATYCHICKKDFKKLGTFIEDNPEISLTIVGVVIDGLEEQEQTQALVKKHNLDYTHLITDYDRANIVYQEESGSQLRGTPSYLLYNPQNKLVAFNTNAIDIDALEIYVYE